MHNKSYSINIPVIVFQAFNPEKTWDVSTHCIMHKNKILTDEYIENFRNIYFNNF